MTRVGLLALVGQRATERGAQLVGGGRRADGAPGERVDVRGGEVRGHAKQGRVEQPAMRLVLGQGHPVFQIGGSRRGATAIHRRNLTAENCSRPSQARDTFRLRRRVPGPPRPCTSSARRGAGRSGPRAGAGARPAPAPSARRRAARAARARAARCPAGGRARRSRARPRAAWRSRRPVRDAAPAPAASRRRPRGRARTRADGRPARRRAAAPTRRSPPIRCGRCARTTEPEGQRAGREAHEEPRGQQPERSAAQSHGLSGSAARARRGG